MKEAMFIHVTLNIAQALIRQAIVVADERDGLLLNDVLCQIRAISDKYLEVTNESQT
jgi:hypothetical protein